MSKITKIHPKMQWKCKSSRDLAELELCAGASRADRRRKKSEKVRRRRRNFKIYQPIAPPPQCENVLRRRRRRFFLSAQIKSIFIMKYFNQHFILNQSL